MAARKEIVFWLVAGGIAVACLSFLALLLSWRSSNARELASLDRGAQLWASSGCMACHDPEQAGSYRLSRLGGRYTQQDLLDVFAVPPAIMPPVQLPLEQQLDLARWLFHTYPEQ